VAWRIVESFINAWHACNTQTEQSAVRVDLSESKTAMSPLRQLTAFIRSSLTQST